MPPDPGNFLSGAALRPCPQGDPQANGGGLLLSNEEAGGDGGAGGFTDRPLLPAEQRFSYLPVIELGRRLGSVIALTHGLAAQLPGLIWRPTPEPTIAFRELDELIGCLERIEHAASEARVTCAYLRELAVIERQRREDG